MMSKVKPECLRLINNKVLVSRTNIPLQKGQSKREVIRIFGLNGVFVTNGFLLASDTHV